MTIWLPVLAIVPFFVVGEAAIAQHQYSSEQGFVPDSVAAAGIATAILRSVGGAETTFSRQGFRVRLSGEVWNVRGRTAFVSIAKRDARILRLQVRDSSGSEQDLQPVDGFVQDATTASAVAEHIWNSIYGQNAIAKQKPFVAAERSGIWTVTGQRRPGFVGGVARIELRRSDGQVIRVTHSR